MDDRRPVARFAPDRRLAWACVAGAVGFAAVALLSGDRAGRLVAALAAVALAAVAASDLLLGPRLVISAEAVTVRTLTHRFVLRWRDVDEIRLDERSRYGLTSRAVEIDAGDHLVVLGRHSLGADPREVVAIADGFRPSVPPPA